MRPCRNPFTLEDGRNLVAKAAQRTASRAKFAIRMKSTGRFIGAAGYSALEDGGAVHLGYWIGEPFWGHGYATEAAHAMIDFVFSATPITQLTERLGSPTGIAPGAGEMRFRVHRSKHDHVARRRRCGLGRSVHARQEHLDRAEALGADVMSGQRLSDRLTTRRLLLRPLERSDAGAV